MRPPRPGSPDGLANPCAVSTTPTIRWAPDRLLRRLFQPANVLSDGAHGVLFDDVAADTVLATETDLADATVARDVRAEAAVLRAERDLRTGAFRRHCVRTF